MHGRLDAVFEAPHAQRMRVCGFLLGLGLLSGCSGGNSEPPPLQKLVIRLEGKYHRESARNDVDLHFQSEGDRRVNVVLTYKNPDSRALADSIGDAAIELVKRTAREDPEYRNRDIQVEKVVRPR